MEIVKNKTNILDWYLIVLIGIINQTNFFRFFSYINSQIIIFIMISYLIFKYYRVKILDNNFRNFLYFSILFFLVIAFFGLINSERYLYFYSLKFVVSSVYAVLISKFISSKFKFLNLVQYDLKAANIFFLLNIFNFIFYIFHQFFNIDPFFVIDGTNQSDQNVRYIYHFLFTAPTELDRFISFFGEPSNFIFMVSISTFIFLRYGNILISTINLALASVSFSGALPVIYLGFLIYYFIFSKKANLKIVFFLMITIMVFLIFINYESISFYFNDVSQHNLKNLGLNKLFMRFFDNDGNFSISRIRLLKSVDYSFWPKRIYDDLILNYINSFVYFISRLGILFSPYIIYYLYLSKYIINLKKYDLTILGLFVLFNILIIVTEFWLLFMPSLVVLIPIILETYLFRLKSKI